MATDFTHPLVGQIAVYTDPHKATAEQGLITSVNVAANLVFVRYSGSTSAACNVDDRLTLLSGQPIILTKLEGTKL